ncbi:MAG: 50S ribosomal protein L22 [Parcubacteria group bacterium GW2011_GWC1_45_9]|nr:MAG: 50S ribosomal protein L22 [Parcubacteria group bacterium GW2011_GWA1_Parcubacteria_45_10]KKT88466.1 MAG: 50S ribosomal protein L22 [Parcubacteria group bacterium GW2011_GWB1_45_10]KKU17302.1 MAG: 50S ribosomal protein L22 [Parcubacteria group bacterium GW2011_GWC1_45_9]
MDSVFAKLKNLRISPKKITQVTRLLKGMSYQDAEAHLRYLPQKSVPALRKLLLSAAANAENNFNLSRQDLFVEKILVDSGPTLKRFRARARGAAGAINKRTSHVTIFLASSTGKKPEKAKSRTGKSKESIVKLSGRSKKAGVQDKKLMKEKIRKTQQTKEKVFQRKAI